MKKEIKNFLSAEITCSGLQCLVMLAGISSLCGGVYYFAKRLDKEMDENLELMAKQIVLVCKNKKLKREINSLLNDENK